MESQLGKLTRRKKVNNMTPFYRCTKQGYCQGQARSGQCKTTSHPERLKCPDLEIVEEASKPKYMINPRKRGPVDPDQPIFWGPSLWVLEQVMHDGDLKR
jgi:hypothetical protein